MKPTPSNPVVWIIDREQWPRAYLRAELIERGYDAVGYETLDQALSQLRRSSEPRPSAIVLELRHQPLTKGAVEFLGDSNIHLIVLGGAVELNDPLLPALKSVSILRRPVSLGRVADEVEAALGTT